MSSRRSIAGADENLAFPVQNEYGPCPATLAVAGSRRNGAGRCAAVGRRCETGGVSSPNVPPTPTTLLPVTAEVVAVAGYVLLSVFLTRELLRGPQSSARQALAAFTAFVAAIRVAYLASLIWPPAAAWWHVAEAGFLGTAVCILAFAYAYGGWAYPSERRIVMGGRHWRPSSS